MLCPKCKKEIADGAQFCPECGADVIKKKKPFFLKWWFILLVIAIIGVIAVCIGNSGEEIIWDDIILGDMLPEPPANKGEMHTNTSEDLWIEIYKISDIQYNDYVEACKGKGFVVDADASSSSYAAYNAEGYKLSLRHYSSDEEMSIDLEIPMQMTDITWPTSVAGKQLPVPKSTIGKFSYEHDDNFYVYIANTSKTDYADYVNACSDKGFNIDYSKGDDYYYADNSEGWHISISYVGYNIMSIDIDAPSEIDDSNSTTTTVTEVLLTDAIENTTEKVAEKEDVDTDGLDPDFKAAMDSYESFMDEYVSFIKKYNSNSSDLSMLSAYADYMRKYTDFAEDFEKWEDEEMNAAETAYYIDVQARVSKKLLEIY